MNGQYITTWKEKRAPDEKNFILRIASQPGTDGWYLFTVPSSTDGAVVMADGDPAEGADQLADLHVENVDEATLKRTALQEDLATVLRTLGSVHDHVDLGVGARTPHISSHHLHIVNNS